jgi:arabinofuranosyltransferase
MVPRRVRPSLPRDLKSLIACGAALLIVLTFFLVHVRHYWFLCDDAFISFRYARNLVEGHGLVFNVGERVEGYTNFLWVLELSALWSLFGFRPEQASLVLSVLYTLITMTTMVLVIWRNPARKSAWVVVALALLFFCVNRSAAVWTSGGLETRQFTAFVFAGCYCYTRYTDGWRWAAAGSVLLALAEYTRPEALMLWGFCMVWLGLDALWHRRLSFRILAIAAAPYVVLVAAHFLFRHAYYDEWLPNTYYAKHIRPWVDSGLRYMAMATIEHGLYLLAPLAAVGTAWRLRANRDTTHVLGWLIVVPHVVYLVRIGGDHFEFRPLDLYWPFVAVAAAEGVVAIHAKLAAHKRLLAWVVSGAVVTITVVYESAVSIGHELESGDASTRSQTYQHSPTITKEKAGRLFWIPGYDWLTTAHGERLDASVKRFVGTRQREHKGFWESRRNMFAGYEQYRGFLPDDAVTATYSIGVYGFYLPDLELIDTRGLTDATVARNETVKDNEARRMAHDRRPPPGYLRSRGVNVEVLKIASSAREGLEYGAYVVELAPGTWAVLKSRGGTLDWFKSALEGRAWASAPRFDGKVLSENVVITGGKTKKGYQWLGRFDGDDLDGWTVKSKREVFAKPNRRKRRKQKHVSGKIGRGMLNTYHPKKRDRTKVTYRSPSFVAKKGDVLAFLVAGGSTKKVGVRLRDESGTLASWRGRKTENLHAIGVELDEWAGRTVWVEVYDRSKGRWGHVLADHFVLLH